MKRGGSYQVYLNDESVYTYLIALCIPKTLFISSFLQLNFVLSIKFLLLP